MRLPVRPEGFGQDAPVEGDGRDHRGASTRRLAIACLALVAIGVLGRLWQPAYNVSPLLGIGICAGAVLPGLLPGRFVGTLVAAIVPAVTLAASNVMLPGGGAYGSWIMAAVVYGAFMWPALLGPVVRRHRVWGPLAGSLAGSLVFYGVTNLAHWWTTLDYDHTPSGLVECFVAALPFYRWMPLGDAFWSLVLVNALPAALPFAVRRKSGSLA